MKEKNRYSKHKINKRTKKKTRRQSNRKKKRMNRKRTNNKHIRKIKSKRKVHHTAKSGRRPSSVSSKVFGGAETGAGPGKKRPGLELPRGNQRLRTRGFSGVTSQDRAEEDQLGKVELQEGQMNEEGAVRPAGLRRSERGRKSSIGSNDPSRPSEASQIPSSRRDSGTLSEEGTSSSRAQLPEPIPGRVEDMHGIIKIQGQMININDITKKCIIRINKFFSDKNMYC